MTLTDAAKAQMADLDAQRADTIRANLATETATALAGRLTLHHRVFTDWRTGSSLRSGICISRLRDDGMVRLLEVLPDVEACPECGHFPRKMAAHQLTVPEAAVIEIRLMALPERIGVALKLITAARDGRDLSTPRGRALLGWAVELCRDRPAEGE